MEGNERGVLAQCTCALAGDDPFVSFSLLLDSNDTEDIRRLVPKKSRFDARRARDHGHHQLAGYLFLSIGTTNIDQVERVALFRQRELHAAARAHPVGVGGAAFRVIDDKIVVDGSLGVGTGFLHAEQSPGGAVNERLGLAVEFIESAHDATRPCVGGDADEIVTGGSIILSGNHYVAGMSEDGEADLVGEAFAVLDGDEGRGGCDDRGKEEIQEFHGGC